jgi:hypothetical protein
MDHRLTTNQVYCFIFYSMKFDFSVALIAGVALLSSKASSSLSRAQTFQEVWKEEQLLRHEHLGRFAGHVGGESMIIAPSRELFGRPFFSIHGQAF